MTTRSQSALLRPIGALVAGVALVSIASVASCRGDIGSEPTGGGASTGAADVVGTAGQGAGGGQGGSSAPSGIGASGAPSAGTNPGTVPIHRLNAFEYDNTVNDLLGLSQQVAETSFIPDETGTNGFDNEADALTMSDAELQQYFTAAEALGEQVFASAAL